MGGLLLNLVKLQNPTTKRGPSWTTYSSNL